MNATNLFTRRISGMDYRVWIAMLFVCFLSVGLYGYKRIGLTSNNGQPCTTDTITVNGKMVEVVAGCYLNRISLFEVQSEAAATVAWNFGDGTPVEKERIVSHKFIEEGTYRVTATVNGSCETDVLVQVSEDPLLSGAREKPVIEVYSEPRYPTPGDTVKFRCLTDLPTVTSYEWKVLETNEVKNDAEPTFTFTSARTYTIRLKLNDDPVTETTKPLEVSTKIPQVPAIPGNNSPVAGMPPVDAGSLGNLVPLGAAPSNTNNAPQPNNNSANNHVTVGSDTSKVVAPPKAPEVDPNAFKDLLQNVVDQGGKEPEDLYQYLDYKGSTMVEVNESKSLTPLKEFCKSMREKKKKWRKIESLSFKKDDKKSIQVIQVKVSEKGFWDKLNPF
jgi:PKD repeat protein